MSTPAEIIAARVNGQSVSSTAEDHSNDYSDSDDGSTGMDDGTSSLTTSIPSLSDESAFPTLGGKKVNMASPNGTNSGAGVGGAGGSWGPSMKSPSVSTSSKPSPVSSSTSKFKPSTIQEAFSLDADDQLNVARPEFIKILTTVKADTKTNIECTTSQHTKKRTFLITGKPEDVRLAKRLVIKKLTKPITASFQVPSKLRPRIIGPQGKTLKPIISDFEVKIDVGNDEHLVDGDADNDDLFNKVITITINGDVEGCKLAKTRILDIVKEETKTLSVKLPIDEVLKPFAAGYLDSIIDGEFKDLDVLVPDHKSSKDAISIIGERDLVLKAKEDFAIKLNQLATKIVVEEVPIPKLKHQFLPIDTILQEENVLIKLPEDNESNVKFIGEKLKIPVAKEKARQTTSQFKVETLDMSKAHKGNLQHVKAIAAFLESIDFFRTVGLKHDVVINAPSEAFLNDVSCNSIPIEIVINTKESSDDNVKAAKREIVTKVNSLTPDTTKTIDDIDEFLMGKVPSTIDKGCSDLKVAYSIIGNKITLFDNSGSTSAEADDFDFEDSSKSEENFGAIDTLLNNLRELKANLESIVLDIPSTSQKHVSGPRNTTLNAILAEAEPHSVVVKFGYDGVGSASDKVYVHGIKSQVLLVKKLMEQSVKDAEEFSDKYSADVQVPSSVLSRLIGKNGQFLNSLRDEYGVKIDVEEDEETGDKSSKVDIKLTGIRKNVDSCKSKIMSLSKKWADETTARLKVENQYHRRMIGPNAVYVNRLQDKYGVRIRFPPLQSDSLPPSTSPDAPRNKDEITVRGPSKAVNGAKEELEELYKFEKENGFEKTIKVPTKAIARVIGRAGDTINDIADATGISYKFHRDNAKEEASGIVEVDLTGSKSGLKEAISKIEEIIEDVENFVSVDIEVDSKYHRDLIGQGGSKMRDIISKAGGDDVPRSRYYKLLTIPNEGSGSNLVNSQGPKDIVNSIVQQINDIVQFKESSVEELYEVPKEKQRFIVGPSGATRQALEKEFNVQVEVPRPNDNSTTVKLSGLPEDVEKLKVKLAELTKDDWSDSIDIPDIYFSLVSERGAIFKTLKSTYSVDVSHDNLTRKASKLSNSAVPVPPADSLPEESDSTKLIVKPYFVNEDSSNSVIPWRLKGDKEQTSKAHQVLGERLELAKGANTQAWYYCSNPSKFSKVIGPQGSTISQIREKSKAFITVPRAGDKTNNYIYLVGSDENLATAADLISKLL